MPNFFAPGRINLIGEHIDYNGGFVLPAAISLGTHLAVLETKNEFYRLKSNISDKKFVLNTKSSLKYDRSADWSNYIKAVIWVLKTQNIDLPKGLNLSFTSDLPLGAGLSSSACIEVLTAFALRTLSGAPTNGTALALEAQRAENEFIGVPCGIMDQFVIANGKQSQALLLNCATLDYRYIDIQLLDYQLVILNSNFPRKLIESKYHERKAECDEALLLLQKHKRDLQNLCSASLADLDLLAEKPILRQRVQHCITEQQRVLASVAALETGDMRGFGALLNASHASLRDDYAVTGDALDALVSSAQATAGCAGARMTGAGFGGCAIALVEKNAINAFSEAVKSQYFAKTGLNADILAANIVDGVHEY